MERVCFLLRVRPDRLEEYRERHRAVWPEMLEALRDDGLAQLLALPARRRAAGRLPRDGGLRGGPRRRWRRRTSTRAGRRRWRSSSSCRRRAAGHGLRASRRSSTLPDSGLRRGRSRRDERPRGRRAPARRRACRAGGGATASPTGRCALPDGLRWNLLHLFAESLHGLRARGGRARRASASTRWGVDYALLDEQRRACSACPFHYRDARTAGMIERAFDACRGGGPVRGDRHPDDADQHRLPAAGRRGRAVAGRGAPGSRWCRTCSTCGSRGELANERTNASTTGLLDARTRRLGARA